ncbi:FKBP-type peptidyl-prolyl cis-trans isomerase [Luteimonas sp. RIT-PG2_3]
MKMSLRTPSIALLAVAISVSLLACKPLDKDTGKPVDGEEKPAEAAAEKSALGALKTEQEKVAYVIGTQIGESLKPIKDDVDFDTLIKTVRATVDGKSKPLDEAEAMQVMQAFGERMQAKQQTELASQRTKNAEEGKAFLAENGKKPEVKTTASGLQYQVLTEGKGAKPAATDTVRVHYKGTLLNGETFDSSYDRNEPVQFALAQVVPGWQEGLQLMPVGSKYKLWVPGELGYGEAGTPGGPIGPNTTLVFEVELLDIVKTP